MDAPERPDPARTPRDGLRLGAVWAAAAALAAPLGVVLHELAHFLTAAAFGFDGAALHFASISYDAHDGIWQAYRDGGAGAADDVLPLWQVGVVAAAGVVFTWVLAVGSALLAPRLGLGTFGGALVGSVALLAPARGAVGVSYLLTVRPRYPDAFPNFDEFRAATALGVPVDVLVWGGVAVVVVCWAVLAPKLGRDLLVVVPALLLGTAAGVLGWMTAGPLVLP